MKVDPNEPISQRAERVWCQGTEVRLHDGRSTPMAQLQTSDSAFMQFCQSLDPNRCFIIAHVPDEADRPLFFAAREAAVSAGVHMQALVETPERLREQWEGYMQSKSLQSAPEEFHE